MSTVRLTVAQALVRFLAVQRSERIFMSAPPRFTIGSIARTIPSFNRGFSFLRST